MERAHEKENKCYLENLEKGIVIEIKVQCIINFVRFKDYNITTLLINIVRFKNIRKQYISLAQCSSVNCET